jgi:hypothetical protein
MEPLVLIDKTVNPTDDLIFSMIGENRVHWQKLITSIHNKYPDSLGQWNYYNDGKNWLFRIIRKKKTIFWIGILRGTFRITFYFGDKAESLIENSDLPANMKDDFKTGKRYGKIRALSIRVEKDSDIENALTLAAIRINL